MQSNFDLFANTMLPTSMAALAAVDTLASQGGIEARGAVFMRREVVDFILDLAGYTPDKPLYRVRLLEPSFGGGDFLLPAAGSMESDPIDRDDWIEHLTSGGWKADGPYPKEG